MRLMLFLVITSAVCVCLLGCTAPPKGGSSLPWSEPANWERSFEPRIQF